MKKLEESVLNARISKLLKNNTINVYFNTNYKSEQINETLQYISNLSIIENGYGFKINSKDQCIANKISCHRYTLTKENNDKSNSH